MSVDANQLAADRAVEKPRLKADNVAGFLAVHLIAALAFVPWFFSWTGVAVFAAGIYVFGVLGINLGFHRLLTHRSFSCPLWLEHLLGLLGTCSLQFSPAHWVAVHRRHHHHADDEMDPHSPVKSFLWAHFGWLMVRLPDMRAKVMTERYARDLMRDPFYAWLENRKNWMKVGFWCWLSLFVAGLVAALAMGETFTGALQFGASLFVWGGAARTVFVWHTTWAVNSVTHMWGYRNYATPDDSRNNPLIGLLAAGEGWHNNHHADPNSAMHGHKWWEFDLTWLTLRALVAMGLATNVKMPSTALAAKTASEA
jgi:fatty-acid desaturase